MGDISCIAEVTPRQRRNGTVEKSNARLKTITKHGFVIGGFISVWSHVAWMKCMPCGSRINEPANDSTNIKLQERGNTGIVMLSVAKHLFLLWFWDPSHPFRMTEYAVATAILSPILISDSLYIIPKNKAQQLLLWSKRYPAQPKALHMCLYLAKG